MRAAEPLQVRLSASSAHRPLITFLMLHGHLRPGYDYLLERKISSLWRGTRGILAGRRPCPCLAGRGAATFSERVRTANASQIPVRLLIQTGRLDSLTAADLEEFTTACRERERRTGNGWWHYPAGRRSDDGIGCRVRA